MIDLDWRDRDAINVEIRARHAEAAKRLIRKRGRQYGVLSAGGEFQPAPGVTTVLGLLDKSRALVKWAARLQIEADFRAFMKMYRKGLTTGLSERDLRQMFEAESEREQAHVRALAEAANVGTQVHLMVEWWIRRRMGTPDAKNPVPDVSEAALWIFAEWEEWAERVEFEPVMTEFGVCSPRHRYAGTVDVLAWIRRQLKVGDWKTSNDFYAEMDLQNVAYRKAGVEMGFLPDDRVDGLLIRFDKREDAVVPFEEREVLCKNDDVRMRTFLHLVGIYPWFKEAEAAGLARWREKKDMERARDLARQCGATPGNAADSGAAA